jgi:hypothetical protein
MYAARTVRPPCVSRMAAAVLPYSNKNSRAAGAAIIEARPTVCPFKVHVQRPTPALARAHTHTHTARPGPPGPCPGRRGGGPDSAGPGPMWIRFRRARPSKGRVFEGRVPQKGAFSKGASLAPRALPRPLRPSRRRRSLIADTAGNNPSCQP